MLFPSQPVVVHKTRVLGQPLGTQPGGRSRQTPTPFTRLSGCSESLISQFEVSLVYSRSLDFFAGGRRREYSRERVVDVRPPVPERHIEVPNWTLSPFSRGTRRLSDCPENLISEFDGSPGKSRANIHKSLNAEQRRRATTASAPPSCSTSATSPSSSSAPGPPSRRCSPSGRLHGPRSPSLRPRSPLSCPARFTELLTPEMATTLVIGGGRNLSTCHRTVRPRLQQRKLPHTTMAGRTARFAVIGVVARPGP
jgi:hypothetical protein